MKPSDSPWRRLLPSTIVALLLALLVTQAASSVCTVQCLQHQSAGAPTHCHAMQRPGRANAAQTCPPSAATSCAIDILANNQQTTFAPPTTDADARSTLLPAWAVAAHAPIFALLHAGIGDPPLLTPLRV